MNYTTFRKAYNTLSDEYRFIIFNFLQKNFNNQEYMLE